MGWRSVYHAFLSRRTMIRASVEIPATASEEQAEAIIDDIRKFRGADAEEDLIVMSGGAKLNNGTMSNDQSKLIELQHLSTHQISRLTDVAPHFLYDDSEGKYNGNPEQAGEDAVRYLFRLLIEQAEDELLKLLSTAEQDSGYTVHIDPNALIRGDVVTESNIVTQQVTAGLISRNDGREAIGYPRTTDPADDKLKTLGDTNPLDAPPVKDETPVRSSKTRSALQPLIDDAVRRIEAKTETHQPPGR